MSKMSKKEIVGLQRFFLRRFFEEQVKKAIKCKEITLYKNGSIELKVGRWSDMEKFDNFCCFSHNLKTTGSIYDKVVSLRLSPASRSYTHMDDWRNLYNLAIGKE